MTKKNKNIFIRLDEETRDELEVLEILENKTESDLIRRFINSVYKRKNKETALLADEIIIYIKRERSLGHEITKDERKKLAQTIKDISKGKSDTDNIETLKTLIELKERPQQKVIEIDTLDEKIEEKSNQLKEAFNEKTKHEKPTKEKVNDLKESVIVFINLNGSTAQKNKIDKIKKASFKKYDEIKKALDKAEKNRSNNSLNNLIGEILMK